MRDLDAVSSASEAESGYHSLYPACKKAYNALRTFGDMTTIELETMTGTSPKVNRNVIGKLMKAGYITTAVARRCKYSGRVVKTYKLKWGKR